MLLYVSLLNEVCFADSQAWLQTWKPIKEPQMAFSGHPEVVCSSDDIVLGCHEHHVLHVVSNLHLIFDKSSGDLGLDLGYGFEKLLVSAVVPIDFLICCSHCDSPPFLGLISEVDARSNYAVSTTCSTVCFGC